MKVKKINWRFITKTTLSISVLMNLFILFIMLIIFSGIIFSDDRAFQMEGYVAVFIYFSPLLAALISGIIVGYYSIKYKLRQFAIATILTALISILILVPVTYYGARIIVEPFYKRIYHCEYHECGE